MIFKNDDGRVEKTWQTWLLVRSRHIGFIAAMLLLLIIVSVFAPSA